MATATRDDVRALIRSLVSLPIYFAFTAVLLFWPAGRLDWWRGWWFLAVLAVCMAVTVAYVWWTSPEMFTTRSRVGGGTKGFDFLIVPIALVFFMATSPVGGIDDGRFHWLPTSDWVVWLGYALLVAGFAITAWALQTNRHFEPTVRIQSDRGHQVVDTGPYAVVRHPGYAAGIFLAAGYALGVGSLWALIPAGVFQALISYRTLREEETLRSELPGYAEYMRRVKYRWVPGVW